MEAFHQMNKLSLCNAFQTRNIPDTLLSALVKIWEHNEIKKRQRSKMTPSI
jgi:hypothetical protein